MVETSCERFAHSIAFGVLCHTKWSLRMLQHALDGGRSVKRAAFGSPAARTAATRLPDGARLLRSGREDRVRRARCRPPSPSPDFFRHAFGQREFGRYFLNCLLVAGSAVAVPAPIRFLPAAAVGRFRFGFRTAPPIMFLMARAMPAEAPVIPLFFLLASSRGTSPAEHTGHADPVARGLLRSLRDPAATGFRRVRSGQAGGGRAHRRSEPHTNPAPAPFPLLFREPEESDRTVRRPPPR